MKCLCPLKVVMVCLPLRGSRSHLHKIDTRQGVCCEKGYRTKGGSDRKDTTMRTSNSKQSQLGLASFEELLFDQHVTERGVT